MRKVMALALILCFLIVTSTLIKADTSHVRQVGGATFIGQYADRLELQADNDWFFSEEIMDPGDHWESEIHIRNNSRKDLEISLLEIINKLPESVLLDIMNLRIMLSDGTVLYDGKYSKTENPVFSWIPLKPGQELCLIIHTGFPEEAGNEFQGRKFDTNWVFQVRAEEDQPEATPTESPSKPTPMVTPNTPSPMPDPITPSPAADPDAPNPSRNPDYRDNGNNNRVPTNVIGYRDDGSQKESDVQTGDTADIFTFIVILTDAAAVLFVVIVYNRKGGHKREEEN